MSLCSALQRDLEPKNRIERFANTGHQRPCKCRRYISKVSTKRDANSGGTRATIHYRQVSKFWPQWAIQMRNAKEDKNHFVNGYRLLADSVLLLYLFHCATQCNSDSSLKTYFQIFNILSRNNICILQICKPNVLNYKTAS